MFQINAKHRANDVHRPPLQNRGVKGISLSAEMSTSCKCSNLQGAGRGRNQRCNDLYTFGVEICTLLMLRFVHFRCWDLCTLCAVISAKNVGQSGTKCRGLLGRKPLESSDHFRNYHPLRHHNYHHPYHAHHHQHGVGRKPAQGPDHFRCRFLAAKEFPIPIFQVHHHFPWYFTDYHKMV